MGSCSSLSAREDPVATDCTTVVSGERRRRRHSGGRPDAATSSPATLSSDEGDENEENVSARCVANPMVAVRPDEASRSDNFATLTRRPQLTASAVLPPVAAGQTRSSAPITRTLRSSDNHTTPLGDEALEMDGNGMLMIPITKSSSFNEAVESPSAGRNTADQRHRGSFNKPRDLSSGSRRRASQALQVAEASSSNLEEFESLSLSTNRGGQHVSFATNPVVLLGPASKAWDAQTQQDHSPQTSDPAVANQPHDNSPNARSQPANAQRGVLSTGFSDVMNFSSSQSFIDSSLVDGSTSTRRRHRDQIAKPRKSASGSGSGTGMMLVGASAGGRLRVGPGGVLEGSYSSSTSATEIGTSYVRVLSRPVITADIMHLPTV